MTSTQNTSSPITSTQDTVSLAADDPRPGFAKTTEAVGVLMDSIAPEDLGLGTPCPDFTVKLLLEHMVTSMRRIAILGNGGQWSDVSEQDTVLESGHGDAFRSAAHDVMEAWDDPARLEQVYEVPWGSFPGGPIMFTYTAELAVHGWDVSTAVGREFAIVDELLGGALIAAKMIPDVDRGTEAMPFNPVVDPGADASLLLQMAGWMGRQVV
jgi:uncharacterized protein (TIGR03086 family)